MAAYYGNGGANLLDAEKSMIDPLSAGIMAGGSLLSSVFSGVMGGQQANRQMEADFAIQQYKNAAAERAAFQNLLAGQYNSTCLLYTSDAADE